MVPEITRKNFKLTFFFPKKLLWKHESGCLASEASESADHSRRYSHMYSPVYLCGYSRRYDVTGENIHTIVPRDICAIVWEDTRDDTGGDICNWLFNLSLVLMKRQSAKGKSHFYILDYYHQLDVQIFIYKLSLIWRLKFCNCSHGLNSFMTDARIM